MPPTPPRFTPIKNLQNPTALAVTDSGRVFVAETAANRVSVIETDGTRRVVAGADAPGDEGDGGPATAARLNGPRGLALLNGDLLIADTGNHRIRRVSADGVIEAFAGTGSVGDRGDGGPASRAELHSPMGLAVIGPDVFVADAGNHRVRRIDGAGTITTFAGTGVAGYSGDRGPNDYAWGFRATDGQLNHPTAVAGYRGGYGIVLYIADTGNNRVRIARDVVDTHDPYGPALRYAEIATLLGPDVVLRPSGVAVAWSGYTAYVADTGHNRILSVSDTVPPGQPAVEAGDGAVANPSRSPTESGALVAPDGLASSPSPSIYYADTGNGRVGRFTFAVGCA